MGHTWGWKIGDFLRPYLGNGIWMAIKSARNEAWTSAAAAAAHTGSGWLHLSLTLTLTHMSTHRVWVTSLYPSV